jgi:hypothetical protein
MACNFFYNTLVRTRYRVASRLCGDRRGSTILRVDLSATYGETGVSANVNFYDGGPGLYQAAGTILDWYWMLGDGISLWAFSVRPAQANNMVEVQRTWVVSNNNLQQTTWQTVSVQDPPPAPDIREGGGGLLRFAAIGSS